MNPDWTKIINECLKPISMLYILIIAMLAISIGFQFWRDRMKIEKKLGSSTVKWLLEEDKTK